jgi:hypothetical protein
VVLVNGWYILGEEVKALKTILRVIVERTIALSRNGLDALTLFKSYIQLGDYKRG